MKNKMTDNNSCAASDGGTTTINRPIPAPRSRVNIQTAMSTDETASKTYENIILVDTLKPKKKISSIDGKMNNVIKEMNFLNVEKRPKDETDFLNADSGPVPAPRIPLQRAKSYEPEKPKHTIYPDLSKIIEDNSVSRSTGAIRKAPAVPGKLNNDLKSSPKNQSPDTSVYTDNDSLEEHSIHNKSTGSTSSSSDNLSGKYKTSSPAELLGMLTKSISERITTTKNNASHKFDKNLKSTKTQLGSRMKNVREKITDYTPQVTFSLGRRRDKKLSSVDFEEDRPKTFPVNDEIFKNISFNSPLNNKMNNLQNLSRETESTYEIPRSSKTVTDLPSYDEAVSKSPSNCSYSASQSSIGSAPVSTSTDTGLFERNSHLTQSLYSNVNGTKVKCASPLSLRHFNRSENDVSMDNKQLNLLSPMALKKRRAASVSSTSSEDSLPCPEFPAPILETVSEKDPIYGKIKPAKPPRNLSGTNVPVEYRRKPDYENTVLKNRVSNQVSSMRAEVDSTESSRIFSRMANPEDEYVMIAEKKIRQPIEAAASASNSWAFYDTAPGASQNQSIGSISEFTSSSSSPEPFYANNQEAPYGTMCELQSNLLRPVQARPSTSNLEKRNTTPFDILDEFDPLTNKKGLTMPMDMKHLNLLFLEEFLGEDTYGRTSEVILPEGMVDSDSSEDSDSDNVASGPAPPRRSDSLPDIAEPPSLKNELQSNIAPAPLRKKSEPTFDKKTAEAQKKSVIIHQNLKLPYNSMENILEDSGSTAKGLTEMHSSSKTTWFANNADKLKKNSQIDPVNSKSSANVEKVVKSTPKLPSKKHDDDYLPSYDESMADNPVKTDVPPSPMTGSRQTGGVKNMLSRAWKLTRTPSQKVGRLEVKTIIEMLPKPAMTDRLVSHGGPLLKLPSGVIEDLLKELSPRTALLRDKIFYTFQDLNRQLQKEQIQLRFVTSIQSVEHQKFNNDNDIHCFEINFAMPKTSTNAANQALCSNPNMIMSSTDCGNIKTTRSSFIFAVYKMAERNLWMQKLLESMTSAFPPAQTAEYTRAGWCYMKKSVTSEWCGAWIVLSKRKLLLHSSSETRLEVLDLRKMRCIGLAEADDSIRNLHVEKGSLMLIDCPPNTMYFIMSSPRDTKNWRLLIKEAAHANGSTLKNQQLTKDNVPVLVDKCINFVYTHGSMSEGIYRKSGSATQVQKLLTLFKQDAFSLQLVRTEYNEHDVSSALKKFMRELPEPLIGKLSDSFIVVSELKKKVEKIQMYKELLARLPTVEYQTLRKIIGHLNFINSQKAHNRMGVENLAMIWGAALLRDNSADTSKFSRKETDVVAELISLYKSLYQPQAEEIQKELIMLTVLQKYHAAAENLSDAVKMSGDLKVWIKLDPTPHNMEEEKEQANVTLTPTKTVNDVCKELAAKMQLPAYQLTMDEVILNDELYRPMHHGEKVLDSVLRWTYWPDSDRKTNYLVVKPTKFLYQIERAIKTLPTLTPNMELKYADQKTKSLKPYIVELVDGKITVFKKEKQHAVKVKELDIGKMCAYLGTEKKRDSQLRWGITLIEDDFKKRSRDAPFIGHLLAGTNFNDQIIWYSSILHNLHKTDVIPQAEIIIT